MKIKRYFTEATFQDAINNGTIQAFDYLHPKSEDGLATSIDAVYIGTHASHWVCYTLINKYSPRWAYTSKYLAKMVTGFLQEHRSGLRGHSVRAEFLSRMIEFTSLLNRLDEVRAETDKEAEVKAKKEHVDARAKSQIEYSYDVRLHIEIRDGIEEYIVDVREDVLIDGEDGSNEYVEGLIFDSYEDAKKQLTEFEATYSQHGSVHITDEAETDVITLDNGIYNS